MSSLQTYILNTSTQYTYNVHVDKQKHDKTWLPFHAFISSPSGFYPARHLRTHFSSSLFAAWILKTLEISESRASQGAFHKSAGALKLRRSPIFLSFLARPTKKKRSVLNGDISQMLHLWNIYLHGNCRYTTPKVTPSERLPAILTEVSLACHYILVAKLLVKTDQL